jgi:uncharacterized protein YhaN
LKIERVRVEEFGRLSKFDSGPNALPGLVVVLGPNEAGKSTLFHFLTTILYGFHPASRDANPYLPWSGEDASGSVRIRVDGAGCAEVERRLRSQPGGTLTMEGRAEDLRNRALPWVEHVPRAVFRQVFAITLSDLAGLDAETWARIQDRMLGSMGTTDLLPARGVAEALEVEAGALWRPHRRGKQRVRDLQEQIRTLRKGRRQALDRDKEIRALVQELELNRSELQDEREARERERVTVERVQTLAPIRAQLRRIAALREEGGPRETLRSLPSDPRAHLQRLESQVRDLAQRMSETERDLREPEEAVAGYDEQARSLIEHSEQVEAFLARAGSARSERARLDASTQETNDLARGIDELGGELLTAPIEGAASGASAAAISALSAAALRARIRDAQRAREQYRILDSAARETPPPGAASPAVGLLTTSFGLIVMASGALSGMAFVTALGTAGSAIGGTLLIQWYRSRGDSAFATAGRSPGREPEGPERRLDDARERERTTRTLVLEVLEGIPVEPALLDEPSEALASDFERLQGLLRDHADRESERSDLTKRTDAAEAEASDLAMGLNLDTSLPAEALPQLLDREFRRAERLRAGASTGERELRRLRRERDRLATVRERAEGELERFTESVTGLGGGDLERGVHVSTERLAVHLRADELADELERTHPDLDAQRTRIRSCEEAGESWTLVEDDLARRRAGIDALSERIEELATAAKGLDRDIVHLAAQEAMDAVDGEIAALQEDETRLTRERDRLWVMAQIIREADRRFREEHQPDLIRRAGAYMRHLTGGRYDRILVNETGTGDIFQVLGPGLPRPVTLTPPVSTGTLEQAYFSLRLAIVDHLDQGGERLPLFIDEAFVNWDRERRARGIEVLGSISRTRQLFVFTCHASVAEELRSHGAEVLDLDR